jgi:hypothetical protein
VAASVSEWFGPKEIHSLPLAAHMKSEVKAWITVGEAKTFFDFTRQPFER